MTLIVRGVDSHEGSPPPTGKGAHTEQSGKASGQNSHAEAVGTANSTASHAEGFGAATGNYSHAEGTGTTNADYAHAEGSGTSANGSAAHAEGTSTTAAGASSHAEGNTNTVDAINAHVEGNLNTVQSTATEAHAEGAGHTVAGIRAHAEGYGCLADGAMSHAEGVGASATRRAQHAKGGGQFAVQGDAQISKFAMYAITTGATPAVLTTGNFAVTLTGANTNVLTLLASRAFWVHIDVVARRTDVQGEMAGFTYRGLVGRDSTGSARIIGIPIEDFRSDDAATDWMFVVTVDTSNATNNYLKLTATGQAAKTIRWVAGIHTTEVFG